MKRVNGTGSVEVLPDGRARIRIQADGKRRQLGGLCATPAIAEAKLAGWIAANASGLLETPRGETLAHFGSGWLSSRELDGSQRREVVKTIRAERSVWTRHIAGSPLGPMQLGSIRPVDVAEWTRWMRRRHAVDAITTGSGSTRSVELRPTSKLLSRSMQTHALRILRQCFASALLLGRIEKNPAVGVSIATGSNRPRDLEDDWLRAEEIGQLLSSPGNTVRDRTAYAAALGLALRLDDLKAVELANVHLDDPSGPLVRVWVGKSEKFHSVPVLPWLEPWLRAHIATLPKRAKYLFPAEDGSRYGKDYKFNWHSKRAFRVLGRGADRKRTLVVTPSALERAGVARKIRYHDLRGTTATHLAIGTWGRVWSLQEIQTMLAHSDQRVTERYVRRATSALSAAAKATTGCPALPMAAVAPLSGIDYNHDSAPAAIRTRDLSLRKRRERATEARGWASSGQPVGNRWTMEEEMGAEVMAGADGFVVGGRW
jgi:integrase